MPSVEHNGGADSSEGLCRNTDLFYRLFDGMFSMIAYMDQDFNVIRVNRLFAEAADQTPESFVGQNYFALFPDPEIEPVFRQVVETGAPHRDSEPPLVFPGHPDQRTPYFDWTLQPIRGEKGTVTGVLLTLVDVTPGRQMRESLLLSEATRKAVTFDRNRTEQARSKLAAAIEQVAEGIAMTDDHAVVSYVNPAFEKITGYARDEIVGKSLRILESGAQGKNFHDERWNRLRLGRSQRQRVVNRKKNGQLYEADSLIAAIRDPDDPDGTVEYVAMERDMTTEVSLEKQLRQARKMEAIGTLAGGIAHELNNILMPVIMNLEMIAEDLDEENPLRSFARLALGTAYRGKDLVKRILSFSHKTEEQKAVFSISDVVSESLDLMRSVLPATIEIERQIDNDAGQVLGNPTQIQELMLNLCNNAAQAMTGAKGKIQVKVDAVALDVENILVKSGALLAPSMFVEIRVSDTGGGIDPEILDWIFDPFFTSKNPGQGTGLGLAVVDGIVQRHGGAVRVESTPEKGTTFSIYLPQTSDEQHTDREPPQAAVGSGERVLLVDDKQDIVNTVRSALERQGYDVCTETSSSRAFDAFAHSPESFDIAVLDYMMPELTGVELAEKLLALRPDLPIVLCTGYSEAVDMQQVETAGISVLMRKPFTIHEIGELIRRTLDQRNPTANPERL